MKNASMLLYLVFLFCGSLFAQVSGSALQFDGVNDYVSFGNSSVFDIDSAVTYEVWIKPDTGLTGFIFNKWVNFQEDRQLVYSGGHVSFYLFNVFGGVSLVTSSIVPLHQYTHIAATYDGSVAKLYVNGVLDTLKSVSSPVNNSSGIFYIGHNPDRFDFIAPFKGIIDEMSIWNVARTDSEIQSTMNQSLNGDEPGLVGSWRFDEGTGPTTADQTVNGNDGTISGAVWVGSGTTAVKDNADIPQSFRVSQNYPNPFNPSTKINYSLPSESNVKISVYNSLGEKVKELANDKVSAGEHSTTFNAENLASGIYIYQIEAESIKGNTLFRTAKKMILMK